MGIFLDCFSKNNTVKKIYIFFLIILFSFLAGSRPNTVPDTNAYIDYTLYIEKSVSNYGLFYYTEIFEVGFEAIIRFLVFLGFNYKNIFFVIALIIGLLGAALFNDKKLPISAWLLFISFYGIYFAFIILRAGLSIVFFACFIKHVKRSKMKAILSLVLSFLFHKSMLFALLIYLVARCFKQKSFKTEMILLVCFFIIYITSLGNYLIVGLINYFDKYIDFSLWNRFVYYLHDFRVGAFNISVRLLVNILVYVAARAINKGKKDGYCFTDKLIFAGILINLFLGSNTVVGRMVDFLLVFNVKNCIVILKAIKNRLVIQAPSTKLMQTNSNTVAMGSTYAIDGGLLRMLLACSLIIINLFFIIRIIL